MQHTYGLYYIHSTRGLQIDSIKAADEQSAKTAFMKAHKHCEKVTAVWNSEPFFENKSHEKSKPNKVSAKTNMGR